MRPALAGHDSEEGSGWNIISTRMDVTLFFPVFVTASLRVKRRKARRA